MKIILIFCFFLIGYPSYSQSDKQIMNIGSQILVKGKITDETTGEPVGTNIEFKDAGGKRIKSLSNSISGEWEQLLPEGKYEVLLNSWNIARKTESIEIKAGTKYKEIIQDYKVKRMLANDKFLAVQAFPEQRANLNDNTITELSALKEIMKFNRGVEFIVYVSSAEMDIPSAAPAPQSTDKKTKGKKKTKAKPAPAMKEPVKIDYTELINHRVEALKTYFADWGSFGKRIRIEPDYNNSKTSYPDNLSVIVYKNEDILNK